MNNSNFKALLNSFQETQRTLLTSKGHDYANEDLLSNFKITAAVEGRSKEEVVLTLISTKVVRLSNLLKSKNPKHESLEDTLIDLANYSFLLNACLRDKIEITKLQDEDPTLAPYFDIIPLGGSPFRISHKKILAVRRAQYKGYDILEIVIETARGPSEFQPIVWHTHLYSLGYPEEVKAKQDVVLKVEPIMGGSSLMIPERDIMEVRPTFYGDQVSYLNVYYVEEGDTEVQAIKARPSEALKSHPSYDSEA